MDVYNLDYNLTPAILSGGRVGWQFQCNECGLEKLLIMSTSQSHMQHVKAHDHYRGECPKWNLR